MNTTPDFKQLREEAYRIISHDPRGLFPEFEFQKNGKGWYSNTPLHLDGSPGSNKGRVWIYDNRPGFFYDYRGGESMSFWDYLGNTRGEANPFTALMDYAGIELPKERHNPNAKVDLVADIHPYILNTCLKLFAHQMGNTDIGCEVRAYLATRKYDDPEIGRMKLGALPELEELRASLKRELSIDEKYINFFIKRMSYYTDHPLTMPLYGKHGKLEGFTFRSVSDTLPESGKYKNMKNVNRDASVLNIPKGAKEVIIVEGVLDALLARAKGCHNVVSLNGTGLNESQIDALAELGVERIILCLDNDEAGKESTYKHTRNLLSHAHSFEVYIADLPESVKDVDQLITKQGMEAFYDAIHYAIGMGEYLAKMLMLHYPKRDASRPLPSMQRRRLLDAAEPIKAQLEAFLLELADFEREIAAFLTATPSKAEIRDADYMADVYVPYSDEEEDG